jgi:hypothetical protein
MVEFTNEKMSYRGRWFDIIIYNVHTPTEDKTYVTNDSFYEELELVFNQFLKYHIKFCYEISTEE